MTPYQQSIVKNLILFYNGSLACHAGISNEDARDALGALLKDCDRIRSEHEDDGCADGRITALKIAVADAALARWKKEMRFDKNMIAGHGIREFHEPLNRLREALAPEPKACVPMDQGFRFHYLTNNAGAPSTIGEWVKNNGWRFPGVSGIVTSRHAAELGYEYLKPIIHFPASETAK